MKVFNPQVISASARLFVLLAMAVLFTVLPASPAIAQSTSVPRAGPGFVSGPLVKLVPAWGVRAYTNERLAYHPRDFGACEVDASREVIYCGVKSGAVIALRISDGKKMWEFHTDGAVRAKPALSDHGLFAGSSDGCLYRLDPKNGRPTWDEPYCTDAAIYGNPVVVDGIVYFSVSINKLYAVHADSRAFIWEHHVNRPRDMSSEGVASPTVHRDSVFIGYSDGTLAALEKTTGRTEWLVDLSKGSRGKATDMDATPVVDGDVLYASSFTKGPVAVRVKDGRLLWQGRWFGSTRPALSDSLAIVGTADGEVVGVRRSDGSTVFVTMLEDTAANAPVLVGGIVVVAGEKGLYSLELDDGAPIERLTFPMGTRAAPTTFGNRLFFVGGGGTVNAVDVKRR